MGIKHDLKHSLNTVLAGNKHGSYATQADRKRLLCYFTKDLIKLGYGLRDIRGLKEKHIRAVVANWQQEKLSIGTIKNRLSTIRRLAKYINKPSIVPSNQALNIGARSYVSKINRAIHSPDFSRINNEHIHVSLQLQRVFGLRREESLKIKPWVADYGNRLVLTSSWCKGGRGREVPISTEEQRYWLDKAKDLARSPEYSLIPLGRSYIQQRHIYDKQVQRGSLTNLHGLRHAYAQRRYKELTGWDAPINGGLTSSQLTAEQKIIDKRARMILTEELGHSREQITVSYLGR